MIKYRHEEEKSFALYFADLLNDHLTIDIIKKGEVANSDEAVHLAKYFWRMVDKSIECEKDLPFKSGAEYLTEKLYNTLGGYLERAGYENEWDTEIDNA